ncbi:MAG: methylmalonyl-CoA mutase family protein [Bacteroidota bacterium]|nr:methylmalonyl-CoA mutase family protein [Bacteroidota bacterium]
MESATQRLRIVTATSLFDGHDAAINIMRRIFQSKGVEVIHLGHNRSVREIAEAAIEEDVQAIAITSYQGGHIEFFKYLKDLLEESGCGHIRLFGGGGGTILPSEIRELQEYGISRIYSPDDGRTMGLEGMIEDVIRQIKKTFDPDTPKEKQFWKAASHWNGIPPLGEYKEIRRIAREISIAENELADIETEENRDGFARTKPKGKTLSPAADKGAIISSPVIGITGTGGAGKSSVTDEIVRRFLQGFANKTIAVISVDPSKKKSGGALLGDRIRMNSIHSPRAYMRSLATREADVALSPYVREALDVCRASAFDLIILESAGTGQSDSSILDYCDLSIYVMTPEYGAASQLEKINMLDYADLIVLNKSDKPGAADALIEVRKQYKRNHGLWTAKDSELPVHATTASLFNDTGTQMMFNQLLQKLDERCRTRFVSEIHLPEIRTHTEKAIIPASRIRYLSEIHEAITEYNDLVKEQSRIATTLYQLQGAMQEMRKKASVEKPEDDKESENLLNLLQHRISFHEARLTPVSRKLIRNWPAKIKSYQQDQYSYNVRNQRITQSLFTSTLSGTRIPRVVLPKYNDWGDILRWQAQENVPGSFPFTAGVFPLKRESEDPTRMFAGEGGPERTNKRFHYVSAGQPYKRLSTAFDSVTLYGEDPDPRPDIFGKVGNSGVSICTVDDAKKLYSGFDLCDPATSVSMTINGPAPMILAFFLHAAIDQQCEKYISENGLWDQVNRQIDKQYAAGNRPVYLEPGSEKLPEGHSGLGLKLLGVSGEDVLPKEVYDTLKAKALSLVRGTVQADILKEDQAQNTCIFSTEFALKLMGDVQEYFHVNSVRNFYSVSISGYHIAEAGANPITQLAFTLANGFTYVEYYKSRGMDIDQFAPNLSFFFSNGMDAEYSVIGRVARRIWSKAMKYKYKANKRSQMLKYHIQTSGRSLHAQEVDFNDIRTTLQALYAIYDNCNSLHTNAYDEAVTTPTEESVRRAMAIQLIINRELGTIKTENFIQGSFLIEELTDLVEEAVMKEFDRLTERGGVMGAMERMYQRNKIQEESLHYESLKHTGELPIVGVNTFLNKSGSATITPRNIIRSTRDEKDRQIENLRQFRKRNESKAEEHLLKLKKVAVENGNLFECLMDTVKYCSLGEITHALYEVGGQYRRNM